MKSTMQIATDCNLTYNAVRQVILKEEIIPAHQVNGRNFYDKWQQDYIHSVLYFSTEATLIYSIDKFVIPADCRDIDTLLYLNKNEIVLSKNTNAFNHIANFKHTAPTTSYPIGLRMGNKIKVLPATIIADVKLYYLRNPLIPKWTYVVLDGVEIFNPSAGDFQDIDMHPSEEDDIITRVCIKMGINLKEPDLEASAIRKESEEFNQQNTI